MERIAFDRVRGDAGGSRMDENKRYDLIWRALVKCAHGFLERKFRFEHENCEPDGPCLIIANHVTNWDPLLLAICFPKTHIHFVASEHLFRMGWKSKAIKWLVAPIPRRKGANGAATAMDCVRKMRAGRTVCVFGEGETTWDGRSQKVFPATGTLAKISGATLITYRFEGGYLTAPRWGNSVRRGRMRGVVVNTYTPEQLKTMKPLEIEAIMNADIYEDAWARQKIENLRFKGKKRAEGVEAALFMCPKCRKIGTVVGKDNEITCSCGLKVNYTESGAFDPAAPFENMAQWDEWQHEQLRSGDFVHGEKLFSDADMSLVKLTDADSVIVVSQKELSTDGTVLSVGEKSMPLSEITDMALIQRRKLAFMYGEDYYEVQAPKPACLRKYYAVWKNAGGK